MNHQDQDSTQDDELDYDRYDDEEFDDPLKYRPGKPTCNEHLVRDLMNYSKFGAMSQLFVMDAIGKGAERVASMTKEEVVASFGANSMFSGEAWHGVATEIKQKMDTFYGRSA